MTGRSRKVYVVNNGGHDYSDARRFGELVFCTDAVVRKDDISQMYRELSVELNEAQPEDYILVTSLTSLCMVAAAIMAARWGEVHFLLYKDGHYVDRDLILDPP